MAKATLTKFPFIALTKALERARALYNSDPGNKGMSIPMAFAAWDYSEKSSGGFQTVSALKQYGLVSDEGANDDRKVRLTDEARRFFASEIETEKERYAHGFAMTPASLGHLAEHWSYSCPPDNVARTYLKNDLGLNEQSARSLLGIYKENSKFLISDISEPDEHAIDKTESSDTVSESAPSATVSYTTPEVRPEDTDRDIFSVSEGEVVLISPRELSAESLLDISDWLDIMKRKLGRKAAN